MMATINKPTLNKVRDILIDVRTNILTQQARNEQAIKRIDEFLNLSKWETHDFEYPAYEYAKTYKQKIVAVMREFNKASLISEIVEEMNKRNADGKQLKNTDVSPTVTKLIKEGKIIQSNKKKGKSYYFEVI
jgi:signal recognition particle subunit SEC65